MSSLLGVSPQTLRRRPPPRFVSHSNKVTQMDSLWEWAILGTGLHPWAALHPGRGAESTAMGPAQGPSLTGDKDCLSMSELMAAAVPLSPRQLSPLLASCTHNSRPIPLPVLLLALVFNSQRGFTALFCSSFVLPIAWSFLPSFLPSAPSLH